MANQDQITPGLRVRSKLGDKQFGTVVGKISIGSEDLAVIFFDEPNIYCGALDGSYWWNCSVVKEKELFKGYEFLLENGTSPNFGVYAASNYETLTTIEPPQVLARALTASQQPSKENSAMAAAPPTQPSARSLPSTSPLTTPPTEIRFKVGDEIEYAVDGKLIIGKISAVGTAGITIKNLNGSSFHTSNMARLPRFKRGDWITVSTLLPSGKKYFDRARVDEVGWNGSRYLYTAAGYSFSDTDGLALTDPYETNSPSPLVVPKQEQSPKTTIAEGLRVKVRYESNKGEEIEGTIIGETTNNYGDKIAILLLDNPCSGSTCCNTLSDQSPFMVRKDAKLYPPYEHLRNTTRSGKEFGFFHPSFYQVIDNPVKRKFKIGDKVFSKASNLPGVIVGYGKTKFSGEPIVAFGELRAILPNEKPFYAEHIRNSIAPEYKHLSTTKANDFRYELESELELMAVPKFKIGDRVQFQQGNRVVSGVVISHHTTANNGCKVVAWDDGITYEVPNAILSAFTIPTSLPAPKFKVGDRVSVSGHTFSLTPSKSSAEFWYGPLSSDPLKLPPDRAKLASGSEPNQASNSSTSQQSTPKEKSKTMSNNPGVLNTLKSDAVEAGYRVASTQIRTAVKTALLKLVESKGGDSGQMATFKSLLDSEVGDAIVSTIVGYGLLYAPMVKNNPRAQKLSEEMRVAGFSIAGNALMSAVTGELLPVLSKALAELPEEEEELTGLRAVPSSEEKEEEEDEEVAAPKRRANKR
jgi:hypothetical protein